MQKLILLRKTSITVLIIQATKKMTKAEMAVAELIYVAQFPSEKWGLQFLHFLASLIESQYICRLSGCRKVFFCII